MRLHTLIRFPNELIDFFISSNRPEHCIVSNQDSLKTGKLSS